MIVVRFIVGIVTTICVATFAVMNRGDVSITWNPLSDDFSLILPVYIVILVSLALGFILGGCLVWLNSGRLRKERRQQKREIKLLENEVNRLKEDKLQSGMPATDIFPALPVK